MFAFHYFDSQINITARKCMLEKTYTCHRVFRKVYTRNRWRVNTVYLVKFNWHLISLRSFLTLHFNPLTTVGIYGHQALFEKFWFLKLNFMGWAIWVLYTIYCVLYLSEQNKTYNLQFVKWWCSWIKSYMTKIFKFLL